ncbi:GntR family transcriptional regulator [Ruegeria sp. Ofav3-42]|uniref:GntR family transcriptional regulator n=1 Tax=Ruegeria sp. Ofav3-42 TaxID=2917759 RepID=UPI001EF73E40|nr:GntR family transcriptional regulator [Ruegeria sp. Ofav3-42]MCG7521861.1 GntR family transcriptional regulator [Ruegeria sp. Ofav3-42]
MAGPRVDDIYDQVKAMAVSFRLRPGDRLNEVALSKELGVSRTPLREALNRLVAERLFDFRPGQGFFCRPLDAQSVFDLFELRQIIEVAAARATCGKASDEDLRTLHDELYATGIEITGLTVEEAVSRDEAFHLGIANLSGNNELLQTLIRINERIRYIRWISMSLDRVQRSKDEHKRVMRALLNRDADEAARVLSAHITKRMDQVQDAVRHGISNIYMKGSEDISARIIEEAS